jgi:hypothetical protein
MLFALRAGEFEFGHKLIGMALAQDWRDPRKKANSQKYWVWKNRLKPVSPSFDHAHKYL